jgi:hypothetical protein
LSGDTLNLTGSWAGRYRYASGLKESPNVFSAKLEETDGSLSGETIEPNNFAPVATDTLVAGLTGSRTGRDVAFRKRYTDFKSSDILYTGSLNEAGSRMEGTWHFPAWPWIRGTFTMIRERGMEAETTISAVEETV